MKLGGCDVITTFAVMNSFDVVFRNTEKGQIQCICQTRIHLEDKNTASSEERNMGACKTGVVKYRIERYPATWAPQYTSHSQQAPMRCIPSWGMRYTPQYTSFPAGAYRWTPEKQGLNARFALILCLLPIETGFSVWLSIRPDKLKHHRFVCKVLKWAKFPSGG